MSLKISVSATIS